VLSLGQVKEARIDLALAEIARGTTQNTFLRDALFSGLVQRELAVLERLLTDAAWGNGGEADKIITGLARGVMGSRDAVAVERLVALAADTMRAGRGGWVAVLDGMVPATGASRRPIHLAKEPAAWAALAGSATAKVRLAKLTDLVIWPGKPGVSATAVAAPLDAAQQARYEQGKALFATVCAACHQANGRGLDGLAPPLVDSDWVLGSPERNVRIVLHGVRGPILVAGRVHSGDMPAFGGALDDAQIASVLTYLRREWGHTATPVDPAQVAAIRKATTGHSDAFSPEELNLIK
jgi:mono/diheme cytochrome c family protein